MQPTPFDQNLVLTGYIGPGQLALSRRIAERLRMPFLHFEAMLEARVDTPIDEFRLRFGETRLKALEGDVVAEISLARGSVLNISGHVLAQVGVLERLQVNSIVVCLAASLDAVLRRLHIAMGARYHDPAERERAIGMLRREWAVRGRPGVIEIDSSEMSDNEVLEEAVAHWRQRSGVVDLG
ncbi:MAG: hypothetical protein L6Q98_10060 [Anaerolineae bacterium]|nr:hypothetical protein [Anaerolineae bacterium]NUQ03144.1 hypothetical protein [Anaerolineae bacterium]